MPLASLTERDMALVKIGRNDPCPCGSGLKYKRCHGEKDRLQPPGDFVVNPPRSPADIWHLDRADWEGSIFADERFGRLLENGYASLIEYPHETVAAWLELWDLLAAGWQEETIPPGPELSEDDQEVLGNWFSDLVDMLMEVQQDPVLARRQVEWVEELLSLWPDWDVVTTNYANFVDLRAEALNWLREDEEAARLFAHLITRDPADPWPYAWWATSSEDMAPSVCGIQYGLKQYTNRPQNGSIPPTVPSSRTRWPAWTRCSVSGRRKPIRPGADGSSPDGLMAGADDGAPDDTAQRWWSLSPNRRTPDSIVAGWRFSTQYLIRAGGPRCVTPPAPNLHLGA